MSGWLWFVFLGGCVFAAVAMIVAVTVFAMSLQRLTAFDDDEES